MKISPYFPKKTGLACTYVRSVDGTAVDGDLNGVDAGDTPHGIVVGIDLFGLLLTFLFFRFLLFLVDLLRLFDSLFGVLDLVFVHLFDRHQVIELVNH